ncbi:MAG: hypothetical protein ACTSYW_00315 [Candidatus Heimdallarchaeota archaeon]
MSDKIKKFDIYGRAEEREDGNLYDVYTVHEAVLKALDGETKDDIIGNIKEIFGL